ncbi:MAG TPA: hypothetical protein VFW97_06040, partial [Acidimicrobiia bacterium]|nr:hypothetical protein [Acidimicrobiia bacterium]
MTRALVARVGVVMAVTVAVLAQLAAPAGAQTRQRDPAVRRVLLISLPATSWGDVQSGDDPNLQRLCTQSAVADMITRT